jgi:hypothetical protein
MQNEIQSKLAGVPLILNILDEIELAKHQDSDDEMSNPSDILLRKLEMTGRVPSREKFRRMICHVSCNISKNEIDSIQFNSIQSAIFVSMPIRHSYAAEAVHTTRDVNINK